MVTDAGGQTARAGGTDLYWDSDSLLPALVQASFFIYTDISRDGMQSGVNVPALEALLDLTNLSDKVHRNENANRKKRYESAHI